MGIIKRFYRAVRASREEGQVARDSRPKQGTEVAAAKTLSCHLKLLTILRSQLILTKTNRLFKLSKLSVFKLARPQSQLAQENSQK